MCAVFLNEPKSAAEPLFIVFSDDFHGEKLN